LQTKHVVWLILALLVAVFILALMGIAVGVSQISPLKALAIIVYQISPDWLADYLINKGWLLKDWRNSDQVIISQLRAPRTILAMLTGAGLAVSGAALQAATRNPLTDPFLLGVSSGASFGAVLVISHVGLVFGALTMPIFSFCGGMISFALLMLLMRQPANQRPDRLVLAGVAISFLLMAGTNALIFLGDQRAAQSVVFWMLGGLGRARWDLLPIPAIVIISGVVLLLWQARNLNALIMGQESAASLGLAVKRVRTYILLLATLITSLIVSLTGTIGFVGLVVPHIVRSFVGGDNRLVLPLSALAGAVFVMIIDIISRVLLAPQELPIGVISGALGGGYFCYLLAKRS